MTTSKPTTTPCSSPGPWSKNRGTLVSPHAVCKPLSRTGKDKGVKLALGIFGEEGCVCTRSDSDFGLGFHQGGAGERRQLFGGRVIIILNERHGLPIDSGRLEEATSFTQCKNVLKAFVTAKCGGSEFHKLCFVKMD